MMTRGETRVARRRVFYIPGYDPNPPRRYRELYRKESRKQAEISGFRIDQKSDQSETGWRLRARFDTDDVEAKIEVMVWHDLVQNSMRGGIPGTYFALLRTAWIYLSTGTLRRLSWLAKGPVLAALYPVAMLLGQLLIALYAAATAASWVSFLIVAALAALGALFSIDLSESSAFGTLVGTGVFWIVFLPVTVLALRLFKSWDDKTYAYYLMQDYAYTAKLRGAYPTEIEARLHEWRHRIDAALRDDVDEVLIVGHSSGAQLAVSVLADILRAQSPEENRPALSLLTLGQVIPMLSFLPEAHRIRSDLHFLSASKDLTWLDVSAPGDGCCFALSDPVSVSGVDPESGKKWPIIISAAFTKTLLPETMQKLKHRYFRLHFQYLCAFDTPGDYDYFRITAGPLTLGDRFQNRRSSNSRIDVPASRFTSTVA